MHASQACRQLLCAAACQAPSPACRPPHPAPSPAASHHLAPPTHPRSTPTPTPPRSFSLWDKCGWYTVPVTLLIAFLLLGERAFSSCLSFPFLASSLPSCCWVSWGRSTQTGRKGTPVGHQLQVQLHRRVNGPARPLCEPFPRPLLAAPPLFHPCPVPWLPPGAGIKEIGLTVEEPFSILPLEVGACLLSSC